MNVPQNVYKDLTLCSRCRCGFCRRGCTTYPILGVESLTARGRNAIALSFLDGLIDASQGLADRFFLCTTCGFCKERCPLELDTVKINESLRAELVKKGFTRPEHDAFAKSIENAHNPYGELHEERMKWLPSEAEVAGKADTAYFVGCTTAYRRPEIAEATVRTLNGAKVDFITLHPEEWCCGSPALRVGRRDLFLKLARHNVEAIRKTGVTRVVTSCAGCYRVLSQDYPEFVGEIPFKVVHASELMAELIKEGSLKLVRKVPETVTYHDPCHLGRHTGIYEQPREVLKSIPAIRFVEMSKNRENARCCGAGGGVKASFNDFALQAAVRRLEEAREVGADSIVSACPFCAHNLKDAIRESGSRLKFYDLTELIAEVMK
ncbi:MAG: (Fe-S)-binding protein [Candidatus Bathyarchaeota archaeon]|nr:(Fe-S)-binding protein [Candidatus Bathyarchaeota archaeon]